MWPAGLSLSNPGHMKEKKMKGNKISAGTIKRRLGRRNLITFHLSFRIFSWLKREDSLGRRVHP